MARALLVVFGLIAAGCSGSQVLGDYRPAIDPANTNLAKFEIDLMACRQIAFSQYEKYQDERIADAIAGALVGAAVGAASGSIMGRPSGRGTTGARVGGQLGAIYGVGAGAWRTNPREAAAAIIDRCLTHRGHTILSNLGRG